jgi:hypothetical protein
MTQAPAAPAPASPASEKSRAQIAAGTLRKDPWWRAPAITATLLTIWVAYACVHVFLGRWYWVPKYHYLTPFYSPCISGACAPDSASLGTWFPKVPSIIPYALVSLPFVLGFRLTCYYYRRAYYRAFWRAPVACAVREPHASYTGETRFPLILQNLHRFFFYLVILISILNTYDMVQAFRGPNGSFGFGLGSLIMTINVILLWAYTVSCHSCRHITGGRLKHFSAHPVRYWIWTQVSRLNARHMQLAWITLGTLMLTDLYIWLVASGAVSDLRFYN